MTTFKKLGMVEYNAQHGNYFENRIYSKVGEEYNEEISRNFIISGIKPGFKARATTMCYGYIYIYIYICVCVCV